MVRGRCRTLSDASQSGAAPRDQCPQRHQPLLAVLAGEAAVPLPDPGNIVLRVDRQRAEGAALVRPKP